MEKTSETHGWQSWDIAGVQFLPIHQTSTNATPLEFYSEVSFERRN